MQRNSREHLLMHLSRKGPASVSEFTQHQVTTAQQTGMDGILILNLLRARNELLRKNILRGVCRFLDEGFTVLSIFKAWEVPPSASHWTIIRTQTSSYYALVLLPSPDVVVDSLVAASSRSVSRLCRPPLEENGHNDSHGRHEITPPQGQTAPCERSLRKHCGFWGQSLPRVEYETAVAALVVVVESVGADESVDASVTVKATISSLEKKKKKKLAKNNYGKWLVFIPAGGDADVTTTAGAASTKRHLVAVSKACTKVRVSAPHSKMLPPHPHPHAPPRVWMRKEEVRVWVGLYTLKPTF